MKKLHISYVTVFLGCCFMAAASVGLCFYVSGIFYEGLAYGLNITLAQAALSTTFLLVSMACMALLMPMLLKKVPFKPLMIAATALCAGSAVLMAFAFNPYWLYFCAVLQGIGAAIAGLVSITYVINNWFYSKTFWILAVVLSCAALSGAIFAPVLGFCVEKLGWRMGFVIQAAFICLFLLPLVFMPFASSPAKMGMEPFGTLEEKGTMAPSHKKAAIVFVQIAAIVMLTAALIGLPQHFSSYASSLGYPLSTGAAMLSMAMIGNIVFKLLDGVIADRFDPLIALLILCGINVIALIGLWISMAYASSMSLQILAFLAGSAYGLMELSAPLLITKLFGRLRFTAMYALLNFVSILTVALSIYLSGKMFDMAQSYVWVIVLGLVFSLAAGLLIFLLWNGNKIPDAWKQSAEKIKDAAKYHKENGGIKETAKAAGVTAAAASTVAAAAASADSGADTDINSDDSGLTDALQADDAVIAGMDETVQAPDGEITDIDEALVSTAPEVPDGTSAEASSTANADNRQTTNASTEDPDFLSDELIEQAIEVDDSDVQEQPEEPSVQQPVIQNSPQSLFLQADPDDSIEDADDTLIIEPVHTPSASQTKPDASTKAAAPAAPDFSSPDAADLKKDS